MKKLILALLLIPHISFAADLSITPGSTVTVNANQNTTVTCSGGSTLPVCILRYSGGAYWLEINGSPTSGAYNTQSDILDVLSDYKSAGVCL